MNCDKPALADSDDIALLDTDEARRYMGSQVLVTLFKTVVLGDEMQILTTDNDRALHLGGHHNTSENTASDAD